MKKWWGKMPFRLRGEARRVWNSICIQERGGEPFPTVFARDKYALAGKFIEVQNKERGRNSWSFDPYLLGDVDANSYTSQLRMSLLQWMKNNLGSSFSSLTFQYRVSRHKIITIIGHQPFIYHDRAAGRGMKGMLMKLDVLSVDGKQPIRQCRTQVFAWNKIIGRMRMLALPESGLSIGTNGLVH